MVRSIVAACLLFAGSLSAGPNRDARLFIDLNPGTSAVDSIGGCPAESTITAAVRISGASKLYSYQFTVQHDTASLRFVSGKAGNDQIPAMLERNGGSLVFFPPKRSIRDSTRILVAASLLDNDASQCVSDSGVLCLLNFKHRKGDTTRIAIDSVMVLDCDEVADTALSCFPGTITPSSGVGVAYPRIRAGSVMPAVAVRDGSIGVEFGAMTDYSITVVTPLGKQIASAAGRTATLSYNCREILRANRSPGGLVLVRLRWQGNDIAVPVLR
jgi:hypothetical protein